MFEPANGSALSPHTGSPGRAHRRPHRRPRRQHPPMPHQHLQVPHRSAHRRSWRRPHMRPRRQHPHMPTGASGPSCAPVPTYETHRTVAGTVDEGAPWHCHVNISKMRLQTTACTALNVLARLWYPCYPHLPSLLFGADGRHCRPIVAALCATGVFVYADCDRLVVTVRWQHGCRRRRGRPPRSAS